MQETRLKENKAQKHNEEYMFYYSGTSREGSNSVGVVLLPDIVKIVIDVRKKSE